MKPFLILFLLFGSAAWQVLFAQCEVDAGENQTICLGESVVLGGNPTVVEGVNPELDWSNGLGDVDNPTVSPVTTTTYTVELEADDCDDTDQITITVLNNPVASFNVVLN
ncbi:MAG: hypothetical protein NWS86_07915, partial [Flavobacteriales bacterium]|nr:hypothetical protein [Flavobacteriales bacterium]